MSVIQLNSALSGFTDVTELRLLADPSTGAYGIKLTLEDSAGASVTLNCSNVSGLSLSEFGGGLTQFLALRAEDVREKQLDRVAIHFADMERAAIAFDCSSADVTS